MMFSKPKRLSSCLRSSTFVFLSLTAATARGSFVRNSARFTGFVR